MPKKKKIFLLLPDGVGLRNFAYTSFPNLAKERNVEVVFWNGMPLDLADFGYHQIPFTNGKSHPFTQVLKMAKTRIELDINIRKSGNSIYESYYFPPSKSGFTRSLKSYAVSIISRLYSSEKGLGKLRKTLASLERKTPHYKESLKLLKSNSPDLVFCTNQRHMSTMAPILAAQDLGIPTAAFIFSWDNLPKATLVLETDYYLVWSGHMKNELLAYYPYLKEKQVMITGTPQFEPHFDKTKILPKAVFFASHGLDMNKKYVCFSGDDATTSPDDPQYLEDAAAAIRQLSNEGMHLGIVFRRSPADFSGRYDVVLEKYRDEITSINPDWVAIGENWNSIIPTTNDLILQQNTIAHTEMVINLGSSMVFDYAAHGKPCAFINYDVQNKSVTNWSVAKIYKFIHFQSMPSEKCVIWLHSPNDIGPAIQEVLSGNIDTVSEAQRWFEKINRKPATEASSAILDAFEKIMADKI